MTPAQLEHLKLIDAHLERLLALAKKRTPGDWTTRSNTEHMEYGEPIRVESNKPPRSVAYHGSENCFLSAGDAAFIASCAGNAEAGWRATRAAIALLFAMCDGAHLINTVIAAQKMGESILAAFPLALVKPCIATP